MTRRRRKVLVSAGVAAALLYAVVHSVLVPYRIRGPSMAPTLVGAGEGSDAPVGDIVLVNRISYLRGGPERWDVVVTRREGDGDFVKRIHGLPGETVEIRDGRLLVNGAATDLPRALQGSSLVSKGQYGRGPVKLSANEYFLLGDAGYISSDSRSWGPVERGSICGKAVAVVWPWGRIGRVE